MRLPLRSSSQPDTDRPHRPILNVAHRGASDEVAENTLAALRRAIAHDADLVEVDVQRTRDGVPVLMHDLTLVRTTDARTVFPDRAPWRVADFTYDELRRLDAGGWKSAAFAGEHVPTLAEAVEVVRRSATGLLVELKAPEHHPGIVDDVAHVLRASTGYLVEALARRRLVVQSFHAEAALRFKETMTSVPVGVLGSPARAQLVALAEWADQVNPGQLSVDRSYVDQVHELGMQCLVWTVDPTVLMHRAIRLGVDGVITNRPHVLGRVLRSRAAARQRRTPHRK